VQDDRGRRSQACSWLSIGVLALNGNFLMTLNSSRILLQPMSKSACLHRGWWNLHIMMLLSEIDR
jgi:hypothetical protein